MKRVKGYKGFIIKETTQKDKEEGKTYNYYCYKNNNEIFEADNIREIMEFIDCY